MGIKCLAHTRTQHGDPGQGSNPTRLALRHPPPQMKLYIDINLSLICRLFPPELFEKFIDVGHYVRELNAYKPLVDKISTLTVMSKQLKEKKKNRSCNLQSASSLPKFRPSELLCAWLLSFLFVFFYRCKPTLLANQALQEFMQS